MAIWGSHSLESCRRHDQTFLPGRLAQIVPDGFPAPVYTYQDNPLTTAGFELGRRLFYDGRLSLDSNFPCASCHQQVAGFGTYEHDRSHGYGHSHTLRNAPVLFNLAWSRALHWDGAYTNLEQEAQQPITTHNEMAENFPEVISRLQPDPYYQAQFRKAFGTPEVTQDRILKALAQFTGYLTSAASKYDRVRLGQDVFSEAENRGYQLFRTYCATCHPEPLFTDYSYRNIGLPVDPLLNDFGRMRITGNSSDSLKFRVPTLRNVAVSENYMHDGRYNTLEQVLQFYASGVQPGPTLDPLLKGGIPLSPDQQDDVYQFLKTLTDSSFLNNPMFGKPQ